MLILSNPFMKLVINTGGKENYQVRAIARSVDEANDLCERNPDIGPICEDEKTGIIFLADNNPMEA